MMTEHFDGKEVRIDYLYLDLNTCDRCVGTDAVLEEVIEELRPAFALAGYSIVYHKIEVVSEDVVISNRFESSPTIRINGHDICSDIIETDCGCCGEISGTKVDCRVFEYGGKRYEVPPKAMLAENILRMAFMVPATRDRDVYELPLNLKNFFEGKRRKGPDCCSSFCRIEGLQ